MANPSLKAQIEAAKSTLASDLAASSVVTPPPKQPMAPIMPGNDIATDVDAADASANAAIPIPANPIPANDRSADATNAATLDERITQLETKLLDNQRDLRTLLQKIREISRLQANSGQSHKNSTNDHAETLPMDKANDKALPHRSHRSPVIIVGMVALTCLVVGITYFLATANGEPSRLTVPNWIPTIIESFNGWIG